QSDEPDETAVVRLVVRDRPTVAEASFEMQSLHSTNRETAVATDLAPSNPSQSAGRWKPRECADAGSCACQCRPAGARICGFGPDTKCMASIHKVRHCPDLLHRTQRGYAERRIGIPRDPALDSTDR